MNADEFKNPAAFVDEATLVEVEGDDHAGATITLVPITVAISLQICPTSGCTRRC